MKTQLVLAFSLFLAPQALAQDGCDFDQAEIEAIVAEAWPAVAAATGAGGEVPLVRIANSREVRDLLRQELLPQMRVQFPKEAQAEAVARQKSRQMSSYLYAKTVFGTGEVLVLPRAFERLAKRLDLPEVCSRAALRGVLVHELVHVADDRKHGIAATAALASSGEGVRVIDAIVEGHAQFVARAICDELGWSEGFDAFTNSIDSYPAQEEGAAVDLVSRVRAAEASVSYLQGELFVRAVADARGEEGVEALFNQPPEDMALVFRPDWYLDPAGRPASRARLDEGLDVLGRGLAQADWIPTRVEISLGQLAASLSVLPADRDAENRRMLGALLRNRGFFLSRNDGRMQSAILYEFPTNEDARDFVRLNDVLMRSKDELMREGAVRIIEATYEDLEEPHMVGVLVHKRMAVNEDEQEVSVLVAAREGLVLELSYIAEPVESLTLVEQAGRILDEAFAPERATRLDLDFEALELGSLPAGWVAAQTNPLETGASTWSAVEMPSAPSGMRALHVDAAATGTTYNLLLSTETHPADLELSVSLCADTGEEDMGGGLVWRAQGPDDYYVTRWNPLEQNLRAYVVKSGERFMLQSADTPISPEIWHELEVRQRGSRIEVRMGGVTYLDFEDSELTKEGRVGLWTKADASTWFDDLVVR